MALMTLHQYLAREERENSVPHELTTLLLSVADAGACDVHRQRGPRQAAGARYEDR